MDYKYNDDDYCDIYENKICDNCGKCLEQEGIDIKAINIMDIAKTVEENKVLEDEYMEALKAKSDVDEAELDRQIDESLEDLRSAYRQFEEENNLSLEDEEYEDAFDHIEHLEDVDLDGLFDDNNLEEMTEEVFPGVRKLKKSK